MARDSPESEDGHAVSDNLPEVLFIGLSLWLRWGFGK